MSGLVMTVEMRVPKTALFQGHGPQIAAQELHAATEYGVHAFQGAIVPETPVDRGIARAGVQTSLQGDGASLVGRVFNPIAHARNIEHGRGAGKRRPPLEPIRLWVIRKLGVSEEDSRSVAFLVARKIGRDGIKAVRMFSRGFASQRENVRARFRLALTNVVERLRT